MTYKVDGVSEPVEQEKMDNEEQNLTPADPFSSGWRGQSGPEDVEQEFEDAAEAALSPLEIPTAEDLEEICG